MKRLLLNASTFCAFSLAAASASAQSVCDTHHLGYTQSECDRCSNMTWSVSRIFPRGVCVSNGPSAWSAPPAPTCTPTHWGGATLSLRAGNFSGTGVRVGVCRNGYDLAKSQFTCSTGTPAQAFNYPTTNITCNYTVAVGGNPQVIIGGTPCCIQ
jgi:hypothetical protein